MIHVWTLSGQELATVPTGKVGSVQSLQHYLHSNYNIPVCMQQIVHDGCALEDGGHVQLVLLPIPASSQTEVVGALIGACAKGRVEIARFLLEAGVDKDLHPDGQLALNRASDRGHAESVQLLVAWFANMDFVDRSGNTALTCSSSKGHIEVVRVLVAAGANMDMLNSRGNTTLICAANEGHVEIAQVLSEGCADLDARNVHGNTALTSASHKGHVNVV